MNKVLKKILKGKELSADEWNAFLEESHKKAPGMTPDVFSDLESDSGTTSYEVLSNLLSKHKIGENLNVVDLACGDGHLFNYILPHIGSKGQLYAVDMSEYELNLAKSRYSDNRIVYLHSKAEQIELKSGACEFVLCHLALMLFNPIEPVIAKISEILAPGGVFGAIIIDRKIKEENVVYNKVQAKIKQTLQKAFPKMALINAGDNRVNSLEGLQSLFSKQKGFANVKMDDFCLNVSRTPEESWDFFKTHYLIGLLPEDLKTEMESALKNVFMEHADANGQVQFRYPLTLISITKA